MGEWQPISTAPKNGTAVLLYCPHFYFGAGVYVGWWEHDHFAVCTEGQTLHPYGDDGATHWQTFPDPPHERSEGEPTERPGAVDPYTEGLTAGREEILGQRIDDNTISEDPVVVEAYNKGLLKGRKEMRDRAARLCDLYAQVNIEAAGDSVLADPVLRGERITAENVAKSEDLRVDGCVHSSMFHAAQNIAATIRSLPLQAEGEDNDQ